MNQIIQTLKVAISTKVSINKILTQRLDLGTTSDQALVVGSDWYVLGAGMAVMRTL